MRTSQRIGLIMPVAFAAAAGGANPRCRVTAHVTTMEWSKGHAFALSSTISGDLEKLPDLKDLTDPYTRAAIDSVEKFVVNSPRTVTARVIQMNPPPKSGIQIRDLSRDEWEAKTRGLMPPGENHAFAIEVYGMPESGGLQTFDDLLVIQLKCPAARKKDFQHYLITQGAGGKALAKLADLGGGAKLAGFKGTVTDLKFPDGDFGFQIEVKSWPAGDPCCGG